VSGKLTATQAKRVLADLVAAGGSGDPAASAAAKGFESLDSGALETMVADAITANGGA
jgi:aspartyl-tRNA(Asn)/glutamyl-tRNA(Gln) amidotransferase subunit B